MDWSIHILMLGAIIACINSTYGLASLYGLIIYGLYYVLYISHRHNTIIDISSNIILLILLSSVIPTLYSISQILNIQDVLALATWQDPNLDSSLQINRVYSTFLNPNLYAGYLLIVNTCYLYLLRYNMRWQNIVIAILLLFNIYLIINTGSRSAWLGLLMQGCVYGIYLLNKLHWRQVILIIGTGLLVLISVLFSQEALRYRVYSIFAGHADSSNSFRLYVWDTCMDITGHNLWTGIGTGAKTFYLTYAGYLKYSSYTALSCYSIPLQLFVELGILGMFGYCLLLSIIVYWIYKFHYHYTIMILLSGVCAILMMNLFDVIVLRPQVMIYFILLLSVLGAYIGKESLNKSGSSH